MYLYIKKNDKLITLRIRGDSKEIITNIYFWDNIDTNKINVAVNDIPLGSYYKDVINKYGDVYWVRREDDGDGRASIEYDYKYEPNDSYQELKCDFENGIFTNFDISDDGNIPEDKFVKGEEAEYSLIDPKTNSLLLHRMKDTTGYIEKIEDGDFGEVVFLNWENVSSIDLYDDVHKQYVTVDIEKLYGKNLTLDDICDIFVEYSKDRTITFNNGGFYVQDETYNNLSAAEIKEIIKRRCEQGYCTNISIYLEELQGMPQICSTIVYNQTESKYTYTLEINSPSHAQIYDENLYETIINYKDGTKITIDFPSLELCRLEDIIAEGTWDSLD